MSKRDKRHDEDVEDCKGLALFVGGIGVVLSLPLLICGAFGAALVCLGVTGVWMLVIWGGGPIVGDVARRDADESFYQITGIRPDEDDDE